jgi:hypothetical protein
MATVVRYSSVPAALHLPFTGRTIVRFSICVLLSAMNVGLVFVFLPGLYKAAHHHLYLSIALILLFGTLLVSLLRTWRLFLQETVSAKSSSDTLVSIEAARCEPDSTQPLHEIDALAA